MINSNKLMSVFFSVTSCCVKEPVAPAEADHQGKEKQMFDQVGNRKNTLFLK
jgi:hypothetical protein